MTDNKTKSVYISGDAVRTAVAFGFNVPVWYYLMGTDRYAVIKLEFIKDHYGWEWTI